MTRDLPTLRDISVTPRQCLTLRFERRYAQRIARRHEAPMWPVVGAIAIAAGLLGAGLVVMLAEVLR